jgi:uncharacterized phage-like protein YoqJ
MFIRDPMVIEINRRIFYVIYDQEKENNPNNLKNRKETEKKNFAAQL